MSEIRATTISDAAGTGPVTLTKQKACKAHGSANQASVSINTGTFNISSYTDPGVGRYSFNYTSAFSEGTYSAALNFNVSSSGITDSVNVSSTQGVTLNSSGTAQDNSFLAIQAVGDLA